MTEEPTIVMHIRVSVDLYNRLEDYWHDRRLPSRSVGARILLEERLDELDEAPQRKREGKR